MQYQRKAKQGITWLTTIKYCSSLSNEIFSNFKSKSIMKKIFLCIMLVVITATTYSQQTGTSSTFSKQDYLQKSKHQKIAAWSLLGGGFILETIGTAILVNESAKIFFFFLTGEPGPNNKSLTGGTILFYTGAVAMIGSIPLFVASHKNKKPAASLSFKNENTLLLQHNDFAYSYRPSISFKIKL